jgi:hypothetical protein
MAAGPVIRGRASICTWNLRFRFYDKNQCAKFIEKFMALEVAGTDNITYECIKGDSLTLDEHWIELEEGVWANNLTTIAKLLEDVDYKDDWNTDAQ